MLAISECDSLPVGAGSCQRGGSRCPQPILSAGACQPERRISGSSELWAMRSLRPLVKARAFGMTPVEIAVEFWMSRMNVWKWREGVILSAGVCQPERRISRSSELWADEIPLPAGESAGLRDDAGRDS